MFLKHRKTTRTSVSPKSSAWLPPPSASTLIQLSRKLSETLVGDFDLIMTFPGRICGDWGCRCQSNRNCTILGRHKSRRTPKKKPAHIAQALLPLNRYNLDRRIAGDSIRDVPYPIGLADNAGRGVEFASGDTGVHQKPGAGGQPLGANEFVALIGRLQVANKCGIASAILTAASSGPIPKAPGSAGGYLPLLSMINLTCCRSHSPRCHDVCAARAFRRRV